MPNFIRDNAARPSTSRENSANVLKALPDLPPSAMSSTTMISRSQEQPANQGNAVREGGSHQKQSSGGLKRSFFDKLKKANKQKDEDSSLKSLPGSTRSIQDSHAKKMRLEPATAYANRRRDGSASSIDTPHRYYDYGAPDINEPRKDSAGKPSSGHGRPKGFKRHETSGSKDLSTTSSHEQSIFSLDTDLTDMEGIISQPAATTPTSAGAFGASLPDEQRRYIEDPSGMYTSGTDWNAPDSWAVRRPGEESLSRPREIDDSGLPLTDEDDGTPYCVRIFRIDSTFATLSTSLNSTVDELLRQLGRKSFLQDNLENYQIVMRKHDLQRILDYSERPIAIQKRLLEQAGYADVDRLDEIGREDNTYLCKFTFVPARLSGVYSLVCLGPTAFRFIGDSFTCCARSRLVMLLP